MDNLSWDRTLWIPEKKEASLDHSEHGWPWMPSEPGDVTEVKLCQSL